MKTIPLTQGQVALVDDEDFEKVSKVKWYCANLHGKLYAVRCIMRRGKKTTVYMHRVILECRKSQSIDHINGDGLNNQKANLRKCRQGLNMRNRLISKNNSSGFKGVHWWHKKGQWGKFVAYIRHRTKSIFLGSFREALDAAKAYDAAAIRLFGEYAKTNKSMGLY